MIVYLDIDGVLNQLQGNYYIDDKCVICLSKLCKTLKADVVLISSWRVGWFRDYNMCTPQVQNLINKLAKVGIQITGKTSSIGNRSEEVKHHANYRGISRYLILDDDISLFDDRNHLYKVNPKTGLNDKDVKEILRRWSS